MRIVIDEVPVDGELSVWTQSNEFGELRYVGGSARGSERHDSSLFEALEPQMLRYCGIEHTQRVKELAPPLTFEAIADADVGRLSRLIAVPIHHEHACLFERRHEKGGRMSVVMTNLNNLWQLCFNAEMPHQAPAKTHRHIDEKDGLGGIGACRKQV